MKKILRIVTGTTLLLMFAGSGHAATTDNKIASTKHDLTYTSNSNYTDATIGICVFCHTPHGADTTASVPLWNRTINSNGNTYSTYSTAGTIDGNILTPGSVSAACLSCHDGTQSMDSVLNAPGSGSDGSIGGTWTGSTTVAGTWTNLGTDLSNDHPVGITYGGVGGASSVAMGSSAVATTQFEAVLNNTSATRSYIATDTNAALDITDLPLYGRDNSGNSGSTNDAFVECATCHDPHRGDNNSGNDVSFLRLSNAGSALCQACHIK